MLEHVLPRAMQLDPKGNFVASPLLREAPSLENGDLTEDPFTVRFRISDRAVWEDGSPITAADFRFTWRAIVSTPNEARPHGYELIRSVDAPDPKTAEIVLGEPYAGWPDLFGGVFGFVLKSAAFPGLENEPHPNLHRQMLDAIPFSGGPFSLVTWNKRHAVLVRNDYYYGTRAYWDQVTFVPRTDPVREVEALLKGEVDAIYPSSEVASLLPPALPPGTTWKGGGGTKLEVLWLNQHVRPLNDRMVRQALLYAIDREGLARELGAEVDPNVPDCGLVAVPSLGPWCSTQPFAAYSYDPAHARGILESDGYDCSGTPCRKDGHPLQIQYTTNGLSSLRTNAETFLIEHALPAGIRLFVKNFEIGGLFGEYGCPRSPRLPIVQCGQEASPDPTVTDLLSCDRIPTRPNEFTGLNGIGWCNPEADRLMKESDRELDPQRHLQLLDRVYELEAEDAIGLPLFVRPGLGAWRSDKIAGPIGTWIGTPYGLFFNIGDWYPATS